MKIWNFFDLIFPPRCVHCREMLISGALCEKCKLSVTLNNNFFCGRCRNRIPEMIPRPACHPTSYILCSATEYTGPIKDLVQELKFGCVTDAGMELAKFTLDHATRMQMNLQGFTIVPIPLSKRRLKERGFNQSEVIAEVFAKEKEISFRPDLLSRTRNTKPQSLTDSLLDRDLNLWNAFEASKEVNGLKIVLIDDVVTSGATFDSAVRSLRDAGARQIICLATAKA